MPPHKPPIAFVVAMSQNQIIGIDNGLPWRLPADMKWFVEVTMGKPVIMGRKTYESIPDRFRPLRGRHTIVVTRSRDYMAPGATVVHSVEEALDTAAADEPAEIIIGGGAIVYKALLTQAERLYLTVIAGEFEGDAFFPSLDWAQWQETYRQEHEADEQHAYAFTWLILQRK